MLLDEMATWPVDNAAGAVVHEGQVVETFGAPDRSFPLASLTKLLTAMAVLVAHEEGTIDLDEAALPHPKTDEYGTVADLLAHASGLAPDDRGIVARPRQRRIYSTAGYDVVGEFVALRAEFDFAAYLHEAVFSPLGMTNTSLQGSPGADGHSTVDDMVKAMLVWQGRSSVALISEATRQRAINPYLPALDGILPGFGTRKPNEWGLGPEIRGHKSPHWTGQANSPQTFGHFGRTGTMTWIDPAAKVAVIALTDRDFDRWAAEAWPKLSDRVLKILA